MVVNKKIGNFIVRNRVIILIILFTFFASLVYSFYFKIKPLVDAKAYDKIAVNLVNGSGYREDLSVDIQHDYAIARVGPLYEYFLAGIYKIFGHHYGAVWVIQAILRAVSVWFLYLTALIIFRFNQNKNNLAILSAAIFGFYPDLIEISAMLMTETFYLFFLSLMVYLFFRFFESMNSGQSILLGLVSTLAILARPPIIFFLPIIFWRYFQKKKVFSVFLFSFIIILVLAPWTIRNYTVYNRFMPLGAAGSFNFWIGNYHGGGGEQEPREEHYSFAKSNEVREINQESMKQFKSFLFSYPGEFFKFTFLRINKYFSVLRPMGFWFYQTGLGQLLFVVSSALASIFLFVFGLAGLIKAVKQKSVLFNYVMAFTFITPLIIFVTVVETRYRFQIYPFLALFSGYLFFVLKQKKGWWKDKELLIAFCFVLLNAMVDLFLSWDKFGQKLAPYIKHLL